METVAALSGSVPSHEIVTLSPCVTVVLLDGAVITIVGSTSMTVGSKVAFIL